jgi:hypothetical protein
MSTRRNSQRGKADRMRQPDASGPSPSRPPCVIHEERRMTLAYSLSWNVSTAVVFGDVDARRPRDRRARSSAIRPPSEAPAVADACR